MKKKKAVAFLGVAILTMSLMASASASEELAGTKVAWVCNLTDSWNHQTAVAVQDLLEENGYSCDLFDTQNDNAKIVEILEQIKTSGDYGLVNYFSEVAQPEIVQELIDAGTCVAGSDIEGNQGLTTTWKVDDYDLGFLVASRAVEDLPENANIVILRGAQGFTGSEDRGRGFHDALAERDDINVLDEQYEMFDKASAMSVMEDWITAYGDIDGVISENDSMALGAIEALKAAGYDVGSDGVLVYGIDGLYEGCNAVEEGTIQATSFQDSNDYAEAALDKIQRLESGETTPSEVEDVVFPATLIDSSNVDEYLEYYIENGLDQ